MQTTAKSRSQITRRLHKILYNVIIDVNFELKCFTNYACATLDGD